MRTRIRRSAAALAALLLFLTVGCSKSSKETEQDEAGGGLQIGYASTGVANIMTDEEALQKAVDEMNEKSANAFMAMNYRSDAISFDGINFSCMLGNSEDNVDDMYIQIFGDAANQDELFLSGLIRPGTAFETITLNHALKTGTHVVYCIFNLVHTDEDGTQSITNSFTVTLDFYVMQN